MAIKKLANRLGYDIKRYHSFYESLLKRQDIKTVMDIGANTGQFAQSIFRRFPAMRVYSFEPISDCYDSLIKNVSPTGGRFQAFNIGLGDKESEAWINRSSFSPSSSMLTASDILKKSYPKSAQFTKQKVRIRRLDDVASDLPIEGNLMVKMDVQGFEDKVILGGIKTISKAKILLIETSFVPLYEGQPLFDDIYETVKKLGFLYRGNNGAHYDKNTDELLFEDSIFIR